MKNDIVYLILISVLAVLLVGFGILGIVRKGGNLKNKELRQAGLILAVGELICGLMGLGYLVYVFWFE